MEISVWQMKQKEKKRNKKKKSGTNKIVNITNETDKFRNLTKWF